MLSVINVRQAEYRGLGPVLLEGNSIQVPRETRMK